MQIVECVPNFSEGRDRDVIDSIVGAMAGVEGVRLLDVDPGADTNRTVVTLVGEPDAVVEAAFLGIARAAELIDMRKHTGAHPRQGATDVCPLVPVSGVTMEDCVALAERLAARVGEALEIPVYLYGFAATRPERRLLPDIRTGEYEALEEKLSRPEWAPDHGPARFNATAGATAIGARKFLIAYNINLNTRRVAIAKDIALEIRDRGRFARDADGKFVRDDAGKKIRKPGMFQECKATGWYLPEFHRAQVTMNLTDFEVTPPHAVFDAVCRLAEERGARVTGSELVGLVPLQALVQAGQHYLVRQGACRGVPTSDLVRVAAQSLGLSEFAPFEPDRKVVEYAFKSESSASSRLVEMTLREFTNELSRDSAAPGGGSVAALCGALGAGLATMVANLTHGKKGYEEQETAMDSLAVRGQALKDRLLGLVDEDTAAFNRVMAAFGLPKKSEEDKSLRTAAIEEAGQNATLVPLKVIEASLEVLALSEEAARVGNQNSLSDAGVGALLGMTAAEGAYYNVLINLQGLSDEAFVATTREQAEEFRRQARNKAEVLQGEIHGKLSMEIS